MVKCKPNGRFWEFYPRRPRKSIPIRSALQQITLGVFPSLCTHETWVQVGMYNVSAMLPGSQPKSTGVYNNKDAFTLLAVKGVQFTAE